MRIWILRLRDVGLADVPRVGGKGANLGHLLRAGLPVPNGYCITTHAYDLIVATAGAACVITAALAGLTGESDVARFEQASALITAQFRELPPELWEAIRAAQRELVGPVAVRSSATAEDLPGASFAGQQETLLDVQDEAALGQAILACVASLWSARAIQYRQRMNFPHAAVKLCVVVQEMVPARVAGVLFTAHPITGDRGACVIEAVRGLGEAVVSGATDVEQYVADKASGELIGDAPVSEAAPVLTPAEVAELAGYGRRIETLYGFPQDIEWAYDGNQVRILQARPITTLEGGGSAPAPTRLHRPRPKLTKGQIRTIRFAAERASEAMRPFDVDLSGQGVLSGVRRVARWFGVTMPVGPEQMFLMEDGVPIALYPQATPRPTLGLLAGVVRALRGLFAVDPSEWNEQEYPTLLRQITALEHTAQQAGDLSAAAVLDQMDRAVAHGSDAFFSRRSYMPTVMLPVLLRRRLRKLFPAPSDGLYADLMSGIAHTTARLNRALDRLAEEAADDPAVRGALHTADPAARLTGTPFLARFEAFLTEFGSREVAQGGASWGEEPQVVWSALRSLLGRRTPTASPGRYPVALDRCLAALPPSRRRRFRRLVERARAAEAMREDSHFMLCRSMPVARAFAVELGRRFVQRGLIERSDDVLFLRRTEIVTAVAGAPENLMERVTRRRTLYEAVEAEGLVPPDWLPAGNGGQVLHGKAASAGVAEGCARLIYSPAEFHKLQPGEVLVCRYTNPAWTPLFTVAAAVVAETGGAASHAAIVAREYGIPAVMGVHSALSLIRDGQRVRVDGRSGEVRLL